MDHFILQLVNGNYSCFLDNLSLALTSELTWVAFYVTLMLLVIKNNKTMSQIGLIIGCAFLAILFTGILNDAVIKPYFARLRPCYDPEVMDIIHYVKGLRCSNYSFFSSHAANTFSIAIFFCLLTRSVTLSVTMFSWAAINAWTRVYLGAHYFTDVLAGTVWGLVFGALVYFFIYRKVYDRITPFARYISTKYTSTGYAHTDIHVSISIFLLTVIGCVIYAIV